MKYSQRRIHLFHSSKTSFSSSSSTSSAVAIILIICVTSLLPPQCSCQLLGSLMSMTGLGNLNPFSGLSSGLSGGGLLSGLRGGSSLFGSLTGSSSSPGAGSMMSSFSPDLGSGSMNYGQQMPMLTQVELAEIMAQQQNQPSYGGHGFDEHAHAPPIRPHHSDGHSNGPRPSPSAPHASEEERQYGRPPRGQADYNSQGSRVPSRGRGYGSRPQSSEEVDKPAPSYQNGRRPPSPASYGNGGSRGASDDDSYSSEERPQRGPAGGRQPSYQGGGSSESSYEDQPYDTPAPASNYHSNSYRRPVADEGEDDSDVGYGQAGSTPVSAAGGYDYPPASPSGASSYHQDSPSSNRNNYRSPRTRVHHYSNSGDRGNDGSESVTSPSSSSSPSYGRGDERRARGQRYPLNEPSSYFHNSMHHPRPSNGNYYSSSSGSDHSGNDNSMMHYNHNNNHDGREAEEEGDDEGASSDDSPTSSYYNPVPAAGPGLSDNGYQAYPSTNADYYDTNNDGESETMSGSNVHFPLGRRRRYY